MSANAYAEKVLDKLGKVATVLARIQPSTLQEYEDLAPIWAADGSAVGRSCFTSERSGQKARTGSANYLVIAELARGWLRGVISSAPTCDIRDSQKSELQEARLLIAASFEHYTAESQCLGTIEKALARAREATPTDTAGVLAKKEWVAISLRPVVGPTSMCCMRQRL